MALSRYSALLLLRRVACSPTIRTAQRRCTTRSAIRRSQKSANLLAEKSPADAQNRYGVTPLVLAVEQGNLEIVNALIAAGANVNHALPEGETILMTAARTGNVPVLQALLKRDARVEARDGFYGETALIWAAASDQADAVTALLDSGRQHQRAIGFGHFRAARGWADAPVRLVNGLR